MNNFPEPNIGLPQFSEITTRTSHVQMTSGYEISAAQLHGAQSIVYTTASASDDGKQSILINPTNKYQGPLLNWNNAANTLMQFCEKQGLQQALNIPNFSQNSSQLLSVSTNGLPVRLLQNVYLPTTSNSTSSPQLSDTTMIKQEDNRISDESESIETDSHTHIQLQGAAVADYLQKIQATANLPLALQHLMKFQVDPIKKEKIDDDEKIEQLHNNILNIPTVVPGFRNNLPNGNQYISDQLMSEINPSDLNIHMENTSADETSGEAVQTIKVEQTVQTESPKTEKKMKFRAKTGEIKIAIGSDGIMLYCCPECSLAFRDKTEIEQHIQGHVQERKYQCKECGAMLKRKEHLDQHMRGHSNERPFKCPVCLKAFKRNEHLTRHYVIHSGDKNFTCNICQKAFSRKDHLNKHTQTHLGVRRSKGKKEPITESIDSGINDTLKPEINHIFKDGNLIKQDPTFLQHIQHLQKDQNFPISTFSAFKDQIIKDAGLHPQQAVNMNEILPQNTRYLMPS